MDLESITFLLQLLHAFPQLDRLQLEHILLRSQLIQVLIVLLELFLLEIGDLALEARNALIFVADALGQRGLVKVELLLEALSGIELSGEGSDLLGELLGVGLGGRLEIL